VNGSLEYDEQASAVLEDVGLVSGAVFSDYDLDGDQDLILATEWGSLKLFENSENGFIERTNELGLSEYTGLWNGVTTGDFNNDGYPDLVATNIGENSYYEVRDDGQPIKIYYGDFNRDQRIDVIDTYYNEVLGGFVPMNLKDDYENISDILGHIQTHEQFSQMTIGEMLRTDEERIPGKEASTLQHMLFMNRGGNGFEAVPLPAEAQFSAAFHASVADINSDGYEDLFISQNFFGVENPQQKPRLDAGRALWLLGDRNGHLTVVPGHESGVKVYGEQRGAAISDFNRDGRPDVSVSQNAAETKLFHNSSDYQGLLVILKGPEHNQNGVGSTIRLVYEDGTKGPARAIQAGSGYWSQNSFVQVIGFSKTPVAAEVTWHTGDVQTTELSAGQTEVVVEFQ
jgi:hypothetical protein